MQFRFYITDLFSGSIRGTNDIEVATNFAVTEDAFVFDALADQWMTTADNDTGWKYADIEEIHFGTGGD